MFEKVTPPVEDALEAMFLRLKTDPRPNKLDLGIGIYRNNEGDIPLMECVRQAELKLVAQPVHKGYLTPLGNQDYCQAVLSLTLGEQHPMLTDASVVTAQTPGAGGALRMAAELVKEISPASRAWFTDPVWPHQIDFFKAAGVECKQFSYYDIESAQRLDDQALDDLKALQAGDILVIHGSCHNPTGEDPDMALWQHLIDRVLETGAIPLIDVAYQGFGVGIEEDVAGLRLMASQVPELILVVSSSKSFGIYRDRAGLLAFLRRGNNPQETALKFRLRDAVRRNYFMPPDHGAVVITEILTDPALRQLWENELNELSSRIRGLRSMFRQAMESHIPDFDGSFFERQKGMFSCLPISWEMQNRMEQEFAIFMVPVGRLNFAALAQSQAHRVAEAVASLRRQ